MLQGAGAMEGQALVGAHVEGCQVFLPQHLDQVLGGLADPARLLGIVGVVGQHFDILLDEGAAAAGGLDDGLATGVQVRQPGVDVASGSLASGFLGVQVEVDGAAAADLGGGRQADPQTVQHAGSGGIGVGRQAGLHAAFENQHLARMTLAVGAFASVDRGRGHLALERPGDQRLEGLAQRQQGLEPAGLDQCLAQAEAKRLVGGAARHTPFDLGAADIQKLVVLDA